MLLDARHSEAALAAPAEGLLPAGKLLLCEPIPPAGFGKRQEPALDCQHNLRLAGWRPALCARLGKLAGRELVTLLLCEPLRVGQILHRGALRNSGRASMAPTRAGYGASLKAPLTAPALGDIQASAAARDDRTCSGESARPDGDSSGRERSLLYTDPDHWTRCDKGSGELAESLLMLAAPDGSEAARQLKHEALVRRRLDGLPYLHAFEEKVDLHLKGLCEGIEPARGDSVEALLVLVSLLVGDSNPLRHLLLGHPEHDPTLTDAGSNLAVNVTSAVASRDWTDRRFGGVAARHWVTPDDGGEPRSSGANARARRTTGGIPLKFYAKSDDLFTRVR
jgi:hypothetical protein